MTGSESEETHPRHQVEEEGGQGEQARGREGGREGGRDGGKGREGSDR